ncbi:hypothetical protein D1P53_003645 [Cryptococcus gattii VGV]|nr:hypothetical protein D1P53_003645 [Cryptococcus gattii VGV]
MDIAHVKASVKAWEKAFKAEHGRDPTKEDIKNDTSDIGAHSTIPPPSAASQGKPAESTKSSKQTLSQQQPQTRVTPRTLPTSAYPTTPTPPSRRSYTSLPRPNGSQSMQSLAAGPSNNHNHAESSANGQSSHAQSLKRKASHAKLSPPPPPPAPSALASSSTARTLFTTPKKKAYSGPIIDPNPVNPFNILNSPGKARSITNGGFNPNSGTGSGSGLGGGGSKEAAVSPFIHASSPKKLKQVLEANSYHRKTLVSSPAAVAAVDSTTVSEGITPRTKARKRLRGEPVEDTPVKDRQVRRRRSHMAVSNAHSQSQSQSDSTRDVSFGKPIGGIFGGPDRDPMIDEEQEGDDEEEEGLGPSPVKPIGGKTFTSLFDDEGILPPRRMISAKNGKAPQGETTNDGKGKREKEASQPGIMGFFGKLKKAKEKEKEKEKEAELSTITSPTLDKSADKMLNSITPSPTLFEPDLDLAEPSAPSLAARHQRRKDKILSLSEDEDDEWDPEGGKVQRKVVIVPTRRQVKRRASNDGLSELLDGVEEESIMGEEQDEGEVDEEQYEEVEEEGDVIIENGNGDTDGQSPHIPLDLLAIASPHKQRSTELESLRVSAIFNPFARKRLLALKRGQEIHTTGEAATGEEEEDADGWERLDNVLEGEGKRDDDWESEDEGWKKIEDVLDDW